MFLKTWMLKNLMFNDLKEIEMNNIEDLKFDLEQKLKCQDWFYGYSDDKSVYNRGKNKYVELTATYSKFANATTVDEAKKIWNSYCPEEFRRQ